MDILHTLFYFVLAVGLLVAIHELGHFWVARKVGVKVIRFSVGFGKVVWSYRRAEDGTEYVLSAIPLGGYVKMVDEREGPVSMADLPAAFNRQPLRSRVAIVAAGPLFNLLLAVMLFWGVLVIGETGMKPVLGDVVSGTLAADAGFVEGEQIVSVADKMTPTWSEAVDAVFSAVMDGQREVLVEVKTAEDMKRIHRLKFSEEDGQDPKALLAHLGFKPKLPKLKPVIGKVLEQSAAQQAGLQQADVLISADGVQIDDWTQWVEYVQQRPETEIKLVIERADVSMQLSITPKRTDQEGKSIGKIGAGVDVPEELLASLRVTTTMSPLDAVPAAVARTWSYASGTLKMIGRMLVGEASVENLSGPISIAQYAGQSADVGLVAFLKYLGLVSVSLGVLNLLPVRVLDGGHLLFFLVEAVKGSPVSEKIQIYFQQIGMFALMSLMLFAVFLDVQRWFQ